jgi:hypothetical protein
VFLVDIILGESNTYVCAEEAGDITQDGYVNVLDVIGLVQMILGGNQQQAVQFLKSLLDEDTFNRLIPQLSVYPNPSNGNVNIIGNGLVSIYDMSGRLVKQRNIENTYHWNTTDVPSGIYFLISNRKKIKITILK